MKALILASCLSILLQASGYRLPTRGSTLSLTEIGEFGIERVPRPDVPLHLHSGIDILPPGGNYLTDEPIFPISDGIVISKRTDGAYAELIIEHNNAHETFWSVYMHIAEVEVELFQLVTTDTRIARFFKEHELNQIGWQFNHFHLEILKKKPYRIEENVNTPERLFGSYSLSCHTIEELDHYFHNPLVFLKSRIN